MDFVANTPGTYVIRITAQDVIGTLSFRDVTVTIVENIDSDGDLVPDSVDSNPLVADAPPGITITGPGEGQLFNKLSNSIVTVTGVLTNDEDAIVTILVDDQVMASTSVSPGNFSIDVTVPDGSRSIRAIAVEDTYRQAISQQRSIVMDTQEPNFLDNEIPQSIASPVWLKVLFRTPARTQLAWRGLRWPGSRDLLKASTIQTQNLRGLQSSLNSRIQWILQYMLDPSQLPIEWVTARRTFLLSIRSGPSQPSWLEILVAWQFKKATP